VVNIKAAIRNTIKICGRKCKSVADGCNLHLCQNWYRQIQQLGITNHYNNDESKIETFLVVTFDLPFLHDITLYLIC